jgi:hypothetical protein
MALPVVPHTQFNHVIFQSVCSSVKCVHLRSRNVLVIHLCKTTGLISYIETIQKIVSGIRFVESKRSVVPLFVRNIHIKQFQSDARTCASWKISENSLVNLFSIHWLSIYQNFKCKVLHHKATIYCWLFVYNSIKSDIIVAVEKLIS